jgi:hypothetical protein
MGNLRSRYLPFGELPQNIVGRISSRVWKKWLEIIQDSTLGFIQDFEQQYSVKIYVVTKESHDKHWFLKDVNSHSSGKYICVVFNKNLVAFEKLVKHELGHSFQSKDWGWLYLPVVGIPSVSRNIWNKVAHKKWTEKEKSEWYYGYGKYKTKRAWPEGDADRRGGVVRA